MQSFEQHSVPFVHVSPVPLQVPPGLITWQMLPTQLPLQQSVLSEHAVPSDLHAVAEQSLFTPQKPEQQSTFWTHGVVEPVLIHPPPLLLLHTFGVTMPHE